METNRTNVIKLVQPKRNSQGEKQAESHTREINEIGEKPRKQTNKKLLAIKAGYYVGMSIINVFRYTLFFMMQTLRGPIRLLCGIFTFAAMIGIPGVWLGVPADHAFKVYALLFMFAGLLFCSALVWFYDSLLLKLAPQQMFLSA